MNYPTHHRRPAVTDRARNGPRTLGQTVLFALAAVVGVVVAAVSATVVAPFGPALGIIGFVVGWPVGFVVAAVALRASILAIVGTGLPADARTYLRRVGRRTTDHTLHDATPRRLTDGGQPEYDAK